MTIACALIVAAGRGLRASGGAGSQPKQYELIGGVPVLAHTLHPFMRNSGMAYVQVVIHPKDAALYSSATEGLDLLPVVTGGATRQDSVRAGLEALAAYSPSRVLIHDAARPFVTRDVLARVLAALDTHPAAIAAEPLADTLKRAAPDGTIAETLDRSGLWRAQTPQGFHFDAILAAHRKAANAGNSTFTDDAALAEWAGLPVFLVTGSSTNTKITTAEDLDAANRRKITPGYSRTGLGFDIHAFAPGDHVWLGGVQIPHTHKLDGHSDADVVLHALTDALLGTIGDGDIGQHFPPSDPRWKGAASILFLEDAVRRVRARGGRILNADITVLAEAPKIGPHRPAIQSVIANALGCAPRDVGVKATTTETLGFVGRREGIAAMAVATVVLPG
ncbi:MAG: bifunctional 2-C-methyl-D-erythritol 4-phosphate cytidylyltransferase/2-C-methyl-D-erythritol 2,4-cyclodiphosphate synthase [Hyphomicrobiaceae bacterium]